MNNIKVVRLALSGRSGRLLEVVLSGWPQSPRVGTLKLKRLGPIPSASAKQLLLDAENYARRAGYYSDTFLIVGYGGESLVALVPQSPCPPNEADEALRQLVAW